jgi:prepilin-type processing-associated H-X9-DG protein
MPSGSYSQNDNPPGSSVFLTQNFSCFVRLLPFSEQSPIYNAVNFSLTSWNNENITIAGASLNMLICPSDTNMARQLITPPTTTANFNQNTRALPASAFYQQFSSYGGSMGTWPIAYLTIYDPNEALQMNGVIFNESTVGIADIKDGTSNTFNFGERSHGLMQKGDPSYQNSDQSWQSGKYYDTLVSTYYPPNLLTSSANVGNFSYYFPQNPSSMHPGGINMAFCDGSVHFIKNSISSWPFSTNKATGLAGTPNLPVGVVNNVGTPTDAYQFQIQAGAPMGVWQKLSTRNGGEVISSDSY